MDSVEAKEERIGFSFPADYKAFLREHPDGVKYYPKVIQKDETFPSFCNPTKSTQEERWLWEPNDEVVGQVEISLWKISEVNDEFYFNNGNWKMKCLCIGSMNKDRLIILDCVTEDVYCVEHDETFFAFNTQEEYDLKMPTKDVVFVDFTSLLDWCTGCWIYDPVESAKPYVAKCEQRKKSYPKNVICL